MIKKIICPTDFSDLANNATQYAAKLAQIFHAELLLIHIMPSVLGVSMADEGNIELLLSTRCDELSKLFHISATYKVEGGTGSLADHIASAKQDNALMVMGTNGSDTLYQRFFGANTYQVIRKASCPVLVVPENVEYRTVSKVVFAWSYQKSEESVFSELRELTGEFNPEYVFLHISTHRPLTTAEVFTAQRHEMERYIDKDLEPQFEQVNAHNVPRGIDDYMKASKADLLAITYFNRKLLRSFFYGDATKKFIDHVSYPILVLHA